MFTHKTNVVAVAIMIALSLLISSCWSSPSNNSSFQQQSIQIDESSIVTISANKLHQDFEDNEVAAKNKYFKKVYRITGEIKDFSVVSGEPMIGLLVDGEIIDKINCFFPPSATNEISSLSKGMIVTIQGRIATYVIGTIGVSDCKLVK